MDLGPAEPQPDRIAEYARVLSEQIGPRLAGSAEEQRAVDYARGLLEGWGYDVEVQPFPATGNLLRDATVAVAGGETITGAAFANAPSGSVTGPLIDAGTGRAEEFPPAASGDVVLVQRQDVPFAEMIGRATGAGASALVIANKRTGPFQGGVEQPAGLPVITIGIDEGQRLRDDLAAGAVEVTASVSEPRNVTAHNVIARRGDACRTISGAHIDSVPWAPGANDDGSGSAMVLELARVAAVQDRSDDCFALWSGEEEGLLGSNFFVNEQSPDGSGALSAYFNYDIVAASGQVLALGSQELSSDLLERSRSIASDLGVSITTSTDTRSVGSDYLSFLSGGVPSLMLTTPEFDLLHTPDDTMANFDPANLTTIANLGLALLDSVDSGLPTPMP